MTKDGYANRKMPNTGGWQDRHDAAWKAHNVLPIGIGDKQGTESSMVAMLKGWAGYARIHRRTHGSPLSEDYFLGLQWIEMGKALRALLNGEIGRLDGGTVDSFILRTIEEAGFSEGDL